MLILLAQNASDQWYAMIVLIMVAGVAGMLLMIGLILIRRTMRRWKDSIERDIARRRAQRTPTDDVWSVSAQRYVDPDALSPEERAEREAGGPDEDPASIEGHAPPAGESPMAGEDEDDPYGLFKDKPYVDPDEDEDFDDPGSSEDEPDKDPPF